MEVGRKILKKQFPKEDRPMVCPYGLFRIHFTSGMTKSGTIPGVKSFQFDPYQFQEQLQPLAEELLSTVSVSKKQFFKVVKKYTKPDGSLFPKDQILQAVRVFSQDKVVSTPSQQLLDMLKMKPVRTGSGVTPVTVLTKPFPCPGKCIFCPNDIRMPKSYLRDEPGAQRAERNQFDPYLQTMSRLIAYRNIGHVTDKVEIIVLGGTWSFYPESYQIWFIKRCFDALNDFGRGIDGREKIERKLRQVKQSTSSPPSLKLRGVPSEENWKIEIHGESFKKTYNQVISELYVAPEKLMKLDKAQEASWAELEKVHRENERANCRCVGLVIETRPDNISETEVLRIRRLGCTKTQIGFQSLQDDVLEKNKRGHDVNATRRAVQLLRQAGFKIHAHWMPNLYGSTPEKDIVDYQSMFTDEDFKPDELKIYPCSLISSAELMQYYKKGLWKPYARDELLHVLTECFCFTPEYCRLTRVIRDIPSTDIVTGNKQTNFREVVQRELEERHIVMKDIRAREIRKKKVGFSSLQLTKVIYDTSVSTEYFLQFVTKENLIAGFLRLSLPHNDSFITELKNSAMIREVHVYGQSTEIGKTDKGRAQHIGLGKRLIQEATTIAKGKTYQKLQVISAVGTREYYRKLGFQDGELYQFYKLQSDEGVK